MIIKLWFTGIKVGTSLNGPGYNAGVEASYVCAPFF